MTSRAKECERLHTTTAERVVLNYALALARKHRRAPKNEDGAVAWLYAVGRLTNRVISAAEDVEEERKREKARRR